MKYINRQSQSGFGIVEALLIVVIVTVLAGAGYYVYNNHKSKSNPVSSTSTTANQQATDTHPAATPSTAPKSVAFVNFVHSDGSVTQVTPDKVAKNADEIAILAAVHRSCTGKYTNVTVFTNVFSADGGYKKVGNYAQLNVNACVAAATNNAEAGGSGANYYLHKNSAGAWVVDLETQMIPECSKVDGLGYPTQVISRCLDGEQQRAPKN